ncbi:MAG: hypothetical protein ABGW84_04140 [Sphingomonadaceae bacterium]
MISLWNVDGVSELTAALLGALVGGAASGFASWILQRREFAKDAEDRAREKRGRDRSLILQAYYACWQAASDQHKFLENVTDAEGRMSSVWAPDLPGLSKKWMALLPQSNLPNPIRVDQEALTVLVDHDRADLLMQVSNVQAAHDSDLKLWQSFGESKRRFGEKVSVSTEGGEPQTMLSKEDVAKLYPHLKELSDLSESIFSMTKEHCPEARKATDDLAAFIEEKFDKKFTMVWPAAPDDPDEKSRA